MAKNIGILGGLGPEATNEICHQITEYTPATKDQEHLNVITYSNPKIPDRTEAILHGGETPVDEMVKTAKALELAGADFIIIPCNTAHYFVEEVQKEISIPIINMIKETVEFIARNYPDVKRVGVLATSGTVKSEVYGTELAKHSIKTMYPNENEQERLVMAAIYGVDGIKAKYHSYPRLMLEKAARNLIEDGAELIICGCTEISLVMNQKKVPYVLINPSEILAKKAITEAFAENDEIEFRPRMVRGHDMVIMEAIEEEE